MKARSSLLCLAVVGVVASACYRDPMTSRTLVTAPVDEALVPAVGPVDARPPSEPLDVPPGLADTPPRTVEIREDVEGGAPPVDEPVQRADTVFEVGAGTTGPQLERRGPEALSPGWYPAPEAYPATERGAFERARVNEAEVEGTEAGLEVDDEEAAQEIETTPVPTFPRGELDERSRDRQSNQPWTRTSSSSSSLSPSARRPSASSSTT